MNLEKRPAVKCFHCGKVRHEHKAGTYHCPRGMKHRTFGYSSFDGSTTFVPKPMRLSAETLRNANHGVLLSYLQSHSETVAVNASLNVLRKLALSVHAEYAARPSCVKEAP